MTTPQSTSNREIYDGLERVPAEWTIADNGKHLVHGLELKQAYGAEGKEVVHEQQRENYKHIMSPALKRRLRRQCWLVITIAIISLVVVITVPIVTSRHTGGKTASQDRYVILQFY